MIDFSLRDIYVYCQGIGHLALSMGHVVNKVVTSLHAEFA